MLHVQRPKMLLLILYPLNQTMKPLSCCVTPMNKYLSQSYTYVHQAWGPMLHVQGPKMLLIILYSLNRFRQDLNRSANFDERPRVIADKSFAGNKHGCKRTLWKSNQLNMFNKSIIYLFHLKFNLLLNYVCLGPLSVHGEKGDKLLLKNLKSAKTQFRQKWVKKTLWPTLRRDAVRLTEKRVSAVSRSQSVALGNRGRGFEKW
jgi:hypothetical protein